MAALNLQHCLEPSTLSLRSPFLFQQSSSNSLFQTPPCASPQTPITPTCPAMAPLGCAAPFANASIVQAPACWNTMGEPPGPIDSRFINTPTREAHALDDMKAAADCG